MAYYSGVANSFVDLRAALASACQNHGWTWDDTNLILSKGNLCYKLTVQSNTTEYPEGIVFNAGTGVSGGTLTGASDISPRMGRERVNSVAPTWPMSYSLHIFTDPDEVYFLARHNIDRFYWAAFGRSTAPGITGTGAYVSANTSLRRAREDTTQVPTRNYYVLLESENNFTAAVHYGGTSTRPSGCFFGDYNQVTTSYVTPWTTTCEQHSDVINTGLNPSYASNGWSEGGGRLHQSSGLIHVSSLLYNQPSSWNDEAILLPINVYQIVSANTENLVLTSRNARYTRVTYLDPESIVTLGPDRWKVYPFIKKDTTNPNGVKSSSVHTHGGDHTGTFGWAIRYDGP